MYKLLIWRMDLVRDPVGVVGFWAAGQLVKENFKRAGNPELYGIRKVWCRQDRLRSMSMRV
jgi:hypothetical protein